MSGIVREAVPHTKKKNKKKPVFRIPFLNSSASGLLFRIPKIFCIISAYFPHTTVEHLQNHLYRASLGSKSIGFALCGSESTRFLLWETQPIRTPALGTSNHQDCFLEGPKSAGVLPWRFRVAGWRFNPN